MVSLIDKLGSKNLKAPSPKKQITNIESSYALSKVVEAKLGGTSKNKPKYIEHLHFGTLRDKENKTPEEQEVLFRGMADLCLVVLDKGIIRTMTHVQLEDYWNVISEKRRLETYIYKPYWLGDGFEVDLKAIKYTSGDPMSQIEDKVSEYLINNIVQSVKKWKENPIGLKVYRKGTKKEHEITKGTWYERCVEGWSNVGLQYSTYRYKLLASLVENGSIPEGIPEDVLSTYEREEILNRLGLTKPKTTNKTKPIGDS